MADDTAEPTWELTVPFIACTSQGGPYDDLSFAAGFDLGQLFAQMEKATEPIKRYVRGPSFRQLDLLAMHRGWVLTMLTGPDVDPDDEEWLEVELTHQDDRDPSCVAAWPECVVGGYDPRCCRFPKSCSCWRTDGD
jgi:hypothetical protein